MGRRDSVKLADWKRASGDSGGRPSLVLRFHEGQSSVCHAPRLVCYDSVALLPNQVCEAQGVQVFACEVGYYIVAHDAPLTNRGYLCMVEAVRPQCGKRCATKRRTAAA